MKRISVWLERETLEKVRAIAVRENRSLNEQMLLMVRQGLQALREAELRGNDRHNSAKR